MKKNTLKHFMLAFTVEAYLNSADKQKVVMHVMGTGSIAVTDKLVTDTKTFPIGSTAYNATKQVLYRRVAVAKAVADWKPDPKIVTNAGAIVAADEFCTDIVKYPVGTIVMDVTNRIQYTRILTSNAGVADWVKTGALTIHS